ncbi:unnamed protein product [Rhizoctonia solani]|nr:unnamed protein product [Rhizoctonia solani]
MVILYSRTQSTQSSTDLNVQVSPSLPLKSLLPPLPPQPTSRAALPLEATATPTFSITGKVSELFLNSKTTPHDSQLKFNPPGFTFNSGCRAPYYEFPLFRSSVYTGGDPSYNRVVIGSVSGSNAAFCDVITHYGASGNNFLQCD